MSIETESASGEQESDSGDIQPLMLGLPKVEKWRKPNPALNADFNSVAISADGSKVVGGTWRYNGGTTPSSGTAGMFAWDANGTHLWPPDTYAVTAEPKDRAGAESVAIAKDGSWAASGGLISAGVGFVHVYDSAGKKTELLSPPEAVRAVALSSDGAYLVAGADKLYLFKRAGTTWAALATISDPPGIVRRVSISDDGQWIATAISGGWTSLVHNPIATGGAATAVGKWQLPTAGKFVQHIAVAGDGSAYAAGGADGRVYYFDIAAFRLPDGPLAPRWQYDARGPQLCRWVAISQDGSRVAAVFSFDPPGSGTPTRGRTYFLENIKNPAPGGDKVERLWTGSARTAYGPNAVSMGQKSNGDYYIAVSDGISKSDGGFYLFRGSDGASMWGGPPNHHYHTTDMNYGLAMSADGTAVVGGSNDGRVYYFDVP